MKKKGKKDNTAKQEAKARKKEEKIRKKAEKNEQKSKKKKEKAAAKAQKQKAKAAAKAKKQDAKKAKAAAKNNKKQGGEEGKKRLSKKLLIPLLALLLVGGGALAATFVLGGKALPAVEAYVIAEESAQSLDSYLAEESRLVKIRQDKLEGAEEEEQKEADPEEGEETAKPASIYAVLTYEYKGVTAGALEQYVKTLLAEEQGFVMVDDEYNAMKGVPGFVEMTEEEIEAFAAVELQGEEPPELGPMLNEDGEEVERKMTEGSQLFAREAQVEGRLFLVRITWTAKGKCAVEVSCPEGAFPVVQEKEEYMNQSSAMDYVSRMSPADLGLPGESMSEYRSYSQGSNVVVDGEMYRKFTVYTLNEKTNTNDFVGVFLISGNGRNIYRQDGVTGELYPVK